MTSAGFFREVNAPFSRIDIVSGLVPEHRLRFSFGAASMKHFHLTQHDF